MDGQLLGNGLLLFSMHTAELHHTVPLMHRLLPARREDLAALMRFKCVHLYSPQAGTGK
jgi:hypothetical protein